MATTGYTKNFVVKNGITTGSITLDANSGNITGTNLSVTGLSNLGNIGNVKITGGNSGQAIVTDGTGNLSFANASATSSPAPMPTYIAVGDDVVISANYQGLFGYPITIDGELTVDGILIDINDNTGGNSTPGGLNTQLQYNNAGSLSGISTATYESGVLSLGSNANIKILGGSIGQYLQTDGTGNLSWGEGSTGGTPGGLTTQVQFNDAGSFAGNIGFTFNKTTGVLTALIFSGFGNALANLQGSNVVGAVPLATYATTANAVSGANVSGAVALANYASIANSVAGANVSGAVSFATTANAVAGANVSGAVALANYASIANSVAGANVSGAVALANYASIANSVAGANVSGEVSYASVANSVSAANVSGVVALANYASIANSVDGANVSGAVALATYATTANSVAGSNVSGAVSYATTANAVAGANVSGAVSFATTANSVAGANVSGAVALATYATTANAVAGANVSGAVSFATTANAVVGANVSGQVANALVAGTVYTNVQPNITSVGTLTSLGVSGNITAANITANTGVFTGNGSGLSAIAGGNVTGAVANATNAITAGTVTTAAQPNITSVGVLTSLSVNDTVTASAFTANTGVFTGNGNGLSSLVGANVTGAVAFATTANAVAGANVSGQVGNALVAGTVYTNAQPNITSVGTLTSVAVTGNVTAGNVYANSGTIGASLLTGTLTTAAQPNITSTGTLTSLTVTGTATAGNLSTGGTLSVTGNANVGNLGTGGLITANGNVSGGNLTTTGVVAATGNVSGGNLTTGGLVNATGNIVSGANVVTDLIVGKTSSVTITATGTNQNINLTPTGTGTVNVGNFIISNVATPVADSDAATKKYVDDVSQGLNIHDSCQAATPTTLASITGGTITYNNGASGVGANLTTTGSFNLIDGINVQTSGTRILVKNEANAVFNGIYVWSNATVITRATDYNTVPEVEAGDFVFVTGGTLYDNTGWVQTSSPTGIGTAGNLIEFTQFSGAGTYTAGTGLQLDGSTFSIANTTVTPGAYGNGDYNATFTVNQQGQLSAAANVAITANAANLTGTTLSSTVLNSSLTSVGTLTTLSVSGNANVGNIGAATGVFTTVVGSLTTAVQPNVTSVGTLTSLGVNGNLTAANITANTGVFTGNGSGLSAIAGGNVTGAVAFATTANAVAGGNVSGQVANALVAGTVYTAAQPNITSVGTLTSLTVTGNVSTGNINTSGTETASRFISNVATGTSPLTVTSTTRVANLNVDYANVADNINVATGTGNNFLIFANAATGNVAELTSTGLTANLSNNSITATTFVGALSGAATSAITASTVTTAAQPNITSVGTLTSLGVNGTVTAVAFTANTGAFTGNGSGLSAIAGANVSGAVSFATTANAVAGANVSGAVSFATTANAVAGANVSGAVSFATTANAVAGGNVSGQVSNALVAGTVYTAAQPNITSVGTLTSLAVTGNISAANVTATHYGAATGLTGIPGANVTGQVGNALVAGTVYTAAQPNITSVGTLTSLNVSGNIGAGNVSATTFTGTLSGAATSATTAGTVTTAAQPNITSVGTLTGLTVSSTISGSVNGTSATVTTAAQPNITSVGTLTSLGISGSITSTAATGLTMNLTGTNSANLIYAQMGDNDQFRILVGATATNAGYVEIATADDGTEPIYVRQYTGVFTTVARTATLLDSSGHTTFPGNVTGANLTTAGTLTAATVTETSSLALKENFRPIENPLEKVMQLLGKIYDRKDGSSKDEAGLVAEDVYKIIPNLVKTDANGNPESVFYTRLTVYLLESIKVLNDEIAELKGKKRKLKK